MRRTRGSEANIQPLLLKHQPHILVVPPVITNEALTIEYWQDDHNICFWHQKEMLWHMSKGNQQWQGRCPLSRVADPHGQAETWGLTTHCLLNAHWSLGGCSQIPLAAGHATRLAMVRVGCTGCPGSRLKKLMWMQEEQSPTDCFHGAPLVLREGVRAE
jgi:hypothetical protein